MHGITVLEASTNVGATRQVDSAIPCVIGTCDIRRGSLSREEKLYKPVIAYSFEEAAEKLGYEEFDWGMFTLHEAMYVLFKIFNISPVVFINVQGASESDWTAVTDETIRVWGDDGNGNTTYTVSARYADPESITITGLTAGTDYTVAISEPTGQVVITDKNKKITSTTKVRYKKMNVASTSSFTGGYSATTGKTSGIDLVDDVYHTCGVLPSVLLAPGFTDSADYASVTRALIAKARKYDGAFSAIAAVDLDTTETKYDAIVTAAKNTADTYAVQCWPAAKYDVKLTDGVETYTETQLIHRSTIFAGMCALTDADYGGIPYASPSNRACPIPGGCAVKYGNTITYPEINLTFAQANAVENAGVWTGLRLDTWKAWGTYTSAVNDSTDPKDIFISVRRMLNWHKNTFIVNYFSKIDNPASTRLIENLIDGENKRIDGLKAIGAVAGGKMEFRASDNPVSSILAGKLTFRQKLGFWIPAREIENTIEIDTDLVANALGGEA